MRVTTVVITRRALVLCAGHSRTCFLSCPAAQREEIFLKNFKQFSGNLKVLPSSFSPSLHNPGLRTFSSDTKPGSSELELVYSAPLKNAVVAVKIFSLSTAALAFMGAPVLVFMGKASVSLVAKLFMSSIVMFASLGSTALLHWIIKGYVVQMEIDRTTDTVTVQTLSLLGRRKTHKFHVTDSGPPTKLLAFSTFEAHGKTFFLHTDTMVFKDRELLNKLLGAYSAFEDPSVWQEKSN